MMKENWKKKKICIRICYNLRISSKQWFFCDALIAESVMRTFRMTSSIFMVRLVLIFVHEEMQWTAIGIDAVDTQNEVLAAFVPHNIRRKFIVSNAIGASTSDANALGNWTDNERCSMVSPIRERSLHSTVFLCIDLNFWWAIGGTWPPQMARTIHIVGICASIQRTMSFHFSFSGFEYSAICLIDKFRTHCFASYIRQVFVCRWTILLR